MELFVASTYAMDERDTRLKVQRFGDLARFASIYGVEKITIFKDTDRKSNNEEENARLLEKYLAYAECPPFLRKDLIPKDPDLQYASILPPLQTLSHGYTEEFREAAVIKEGNGYSILNAGLEDEVRIAHELPEGARLTIMQTDNGWEPIDPADINGYWTYSVASIRQPLGEVLPDDRPIIGTSAHGEDYTGLADVQYDLEDAVVVIGGPWRGLYDLMERGDVSEDAFDGIYDFVPDQHTKTVRSTEAVGIVLSGLDTIKRLR